MGILHPHKSRCKVEAAAAIPTLCLSQGQDGVYLACGDFSVQKLEAAFALNAGLYEGQPTIRLDIGMSEEVLPPPAKLMALSGWATTGQKEWNGLSCGPAGG